MMGVKAITGVCAGVVVVTIGAVHLGTILGVTIIPGTLMKAVGAMAGGGIGWYKGLLDAGTDIKRRVKKKRISKDEK